MNSNTANEISKNETNITELTLTTMTVVEPKPLVEPDPLVEPKPLVEPLVEALVEPDPLVEPETNPINATNLLSQIVLKQYSEKVRKDIWLGSQFQHIGDLENEYVGRAGEQLLQQLCDAANIEASIDGAKTKEKGGGCGDGAILQKTVEIKTARAGTGTTMSFQHELGEKPWMADYMAFIDIAPDVFYVSLFPNFKEELYKSSCKCEPYFPSRSFCWRKGTGCFKLDTTRKINESQSLIPNPNTLRICNSTTIDSIGKFIRRIVN